MAQAQPEGGFDRDTPERSNLATREAEPSLALGAVISSPASPSYDTIQFRINPGKYTRPGKFVAIEAKDDRDQDVLVLARVEGVHETNPHEDALSSTLRNVLPFETRYAGEGSSTVIYRVATSDPLEEAVLDANGEILAIRAVESLPRAGALVLEAGPDLTNRALGLEPDPSGGLYVGDVYGEPETHVTLGRNVVQRHIFIGGGIGSGKSYTRGVLAEELHSWGVPQVNIDVNGEMMEATVELGGMNLQPGRKGGFTVPLSALSAEDVVDAVPSINRGTNMETLLRFSFERLQKKIIDGTMDFFSVNELVAEIEPAAQILDMLKTKATVEPTKLRTLSLNRLDFLGSPFDWEKHLQPGAIINIDCRSLTLTELRLVTASVSRDLQRLARRRKIPFVVLSIDEFHLVAPNQEDTLTTQVLREIARIGRHYKLGLILTTQSPSDVDRSILKRLLTRFLHAIEPDQLDALRGVFSDASEDLVRMLPKLPQGTCIVTGAFETLRHATVVKIRQRETTHGGKTPDIWPDYEAKGWTGKRPLRIEAKRTER